MEISEQNKSGDELHLIGMVIEMRPKFDCLGKEKPKEESRKRSGRSHYHLIRSRAENRLVQCVPEKAVVDKGRRVQE